MQRRRRRIWTSTSTTTSPQGHQRNPSICRILRVEIILLLLEQRYWYPVGGTLGCLGGLRTTHKPEVPHPFRITTKDNNNNNNRMDLISNNKDSTSFVSYSYYILSGAGYLNYNPTNLSTLMPLRLGEDQPWERVSVSDTVIRVNTGTSSAAGGSGGALAVWCWWNECGKRWKRLGER